MKITFADRGEKVRLDDIPAEPPQRMTKEKARSRFAALGEEMFELQDAMFGARVNSVMVVLQGRDSAGKVVLQPRDRRSHRRCAARAPQGLEKDPRRDGQGRPRRSRRLPRGARGEEATLDLQFLQQLLLELQDDFRVPQRFT